MKQILTKVSLLLFIVLGIECVAQSQALPLPYRFKNVSDYPNDSIYVGLVGRVDNQGVWMDLETMVVNTIDSSWNTVKGPEGSVGALGSQYFANCFTKLSDIPNQTIQLPLIASVRIFIGFGEQMYLYFFDDGGYAGADLSNQTDPNQDVRFEMIELTYNNYGLWTNTTRVDNYQYPMGQEVWGSNGFYKRVGEVLSHEEIIAKWQNEAPSTFQPCLEQEKEIIHAPSKINAFKEGGVSFDFYDAFVDSLWAEYTDRSLSVSIGDEGVWTGQVINNEFQFENVSGKKALIADKPNTQEIFEGKGVLASDEASTPDPNADLNIQKHFCAAINRGAIDLSVPSTETVSWGDEADFFPEDGTPYNFYVKFWHMPEVSYNGQTYAFAYDDVFDYSSTTHTTAPDSVLITLGGFSYLNSDTLSYIAISPKNVSLSIGEYQQFSVTGYSQNGNLVNLEDYNWEGCNSEGLFTAIEAGDYQVIVTANNFKDTASIRVNSEISSINQVVKEVKLYPTVTNNNLHIEYKGIENYKVLIQSQTGQVLRTYIFTNAKNTINVSSLPSGMYFLSLMDKNNVKTKAFIRK